MMKIEQKHIAFALKKEPNIRHVLCHNVRAIIITKYFFSKIKVSYFPVTKLSKNLTHVA